MIASAPITAGYACEPPTCLSASQSREIHASAEIYLFPKGSTHYVDNKNWRRSSAGGSFDPERTRISPGSWRRTVPEEDVHTSHTSVDHPFITVAADRLSASSNSSTRPDGPAKIAATGSEDVCDERRRRRALLSPLPSKEDLALSTGDSLGTRIPSRCLPLHPIVAQPRPTDRLIGSVDFGRRS